MQGGFFPTKPIDSFALWANILNATEGRFFIVVYRKKDGSVRRLNGRIFEKIDPSKGFRHLIVRDIQLRKSDKFQDGYRKIDPNAILGFKCGDFQIGRLSSEPKKESKNA